jgi:hypothetical protein
MSGFELLKGVRDLDTTLDDYRPKNWRGNQFERESPRNELGHFRLDEIAKAIRALTYGEMLELAESMWKVNSLASEITESDLPRVLHRWSASQR